MPSTFNPKVEATRRVLSRTPAYSILKVEDSGNIVNIVTGVSFSNIQDAITDLSSYNLVDFRRLGADAFSMGQSVGSAPIQSELSALNAFLRDPSSELALRNRGLGHLFGQQLDAAYMQFNWDSNKQTLKNLMDKGSPYARFSGITALTDEGMIRVSHRISGTDTVLTAAQQSMLKSLSGVPTFTADFIEGIFSDISSTVTLPAGSEERTEALSRISGKLGKLPKRQTRNISPREVGFDSTEIQRALGSFKTSAGEAGEFAYTYDHVDLLLRKAAGDRTITAAEDLILASSGGYYKRRNFLITTRRCRAGAWLCWPKTPNGRCRSA
jgi:hypothetical protein